MIAKKCNGGRLLEIDNVHTTDGGLPPSLDATDKYVGYFENPHGEQWVFIGDPKTGKAMIHGGDVGWETKYELSLQSPCPNTILNEPEKMWIITCFMAMSHTSFDEVVANYKKTAKLLVVAARQTSEGETR